MALTPRQQRFVQEYLVDRDAKAAALRAGYAESAACVAAVHLLQHTAIKEALAEAEAERAAADAKVTLGAEDVIRGLYEEARRVGRDSSHQARVSAWTALGKAFGMFVDKSEVGKPGDFARLSDEELDRAIAQKLDRIAPKKPAPVKGSVKIH